MRVQFLIDWQSLDGSASFKKDEVFDVEETLAWDLAIQGIVKFKKKPDLEVEKAKQIFKVSKRKRSSS